MTEKEVNVLTVVVLAVGTAASLYAVFRQYPLQSRNVAGQTATIRRIQQPNRDRHLGKPGRTRKYFGYSGPSSAQGAGLAASPNPAVGLFPSRNIIKPKIKGTISTMNRPTRPPGQNNKRFRPIVNAQFRRVPGH